MRKDAERVLDRVKNHLNNNEYPGLIRVILFGSQARNEALASSDIDLAIVVDTDKFDIVSRGMFRCMDDLVDSNIEIDIFFTTEQALIEATRQFNTNTHIKKEGITIWQRKHI